MKLTVGLKGSSESCIWCAGQCSATELYVQQYAPNRNKTAHLHQAQTPPL